jgi:hypothetical protein
MGFAGAANAAATVDDIALLKHSYVLVMDDVTNNGSAKPGKGNLFGDNHFLDVTGGSVATNKGSVDLSSVDGTIVTEEIAAKYGEYGSHLNSFRLKDQQDYIAMKVTAGSKIIIFYENNKAARYPLFSNTTDKPKDNKLSNQPTPVTAVIGNKGIGKIEYTASDDMTLVVCAENQIFLSYIIIEAKEAPGTPTVKVGNQSYENGLWFKEVTCKANPMKEEGSTEEIPTIVTYTTDGSAPTASSPKYKEPIKCYSNQTVKFQAYMDLMGTGEITDEDICGGADNEGNVNFSFDAPTITADGATFTITTPYAEQGGSNFYTLNGGEEKAGNGETLTESATVVAYTKIVNGAHATFTTKSASKDVYALQPIKATKTITVTAGTAVVDEEATAASTTGTVYKIEGGEISADKADFFVKNLTFAALANADAAKAPYQVPAGQEAYIQMSNTNITFEVAEGDSVDVVVTCSKNACKNIAAADAEDGSQVNDRKCYINVDGTNYCAKDAEGNETSDLKLYPETANIVKFGLKAGIHTFQKYSGTGNILVSSIEITPVEATGIQNVKNAAQAQDGAIYNLAGQKVDAAYKGLVIKNGKKFVNK